MVADDIRRAIETATRLTLPAVTALLWRAFGEERITEAEAEALSVLIETRQRSAPAQTAGQTSNPTGTGHTEETGDPQTLVRAPRRAWAPARGRMLASNADAAGRPPGGFLRLSRLGSRWLSRQPCHSSRPRRPARATAACPFPHLAAVAGVAETTVRNAIREARKLGLLTVEERRVTGYRNDTNVVRIVSPNGRLGCGWRGRGHRCARPSEGVGANPRTGLLLSF